MSYRLAIAISGAVSLGSYEAGVLYEIIRAIGAHNERVTDPEERIEIDVLTGASAGGMTAAIVAQKLLLDQDALQEPLDNALYNPWVRDIDIRELLVEHPEDNPSNAIFSGAVIARLAEQHFLAPLDGRTLSGRHPAAGPQVHLGLALSNLVGIDYQIPTFQHSDLLRPADGFAYRRFEDKLLATITPATTDRAFWSQIAAAARACGAFPFAFPAVEVPRRLDEPAYTLSGSRLVDWSPHSGRFTYTDGGVFNNYPLGMAKQLANLVDTEPNDYTRRF
ncbi:MAG: patatin-like phospholipase family protein [Verrucomicrobiota bacterium]